MPLYDTKCPKCGIIENIWAKIDEIKPKCPKCGGETERLISPCSIKCDIAPYFDENLANPQKSPHGQWVESRQHRQKLMKELNLAEFG